FDYGPYASANTVDPLTAQRYREVYSRDALLAQVRRNLPGFPTDRVRHVSHHLAHAASAYYTSGWDECLVVVIDGMGEVHGASIYHARDGRLEKLQDISAADSMGILYSLITLHLGFDFNSDEYKIMGLAPYGNPKRFQSFFDQAVQLRSDGTFRIPALRMNKARDERELFLGSRKFLADQLIPERKPDSPLTGDHEDVAAALQVCLDRVVVHLCGTFGRKTGLRRLALAGGVALNCTANGVLLRSGLFEDMYVQPAAGDDGAALGAALYRASIANEIRNERFPVPFLGPGYSPADVEDALSHFADSIVVI